MVCLCLLSVTGPGAAEGLTAPVGAGLDDAYAASGSNSNGFNAIDVRFGRYLDGSTYTGYLRFQIAIPAGSVITSAVVQGTGAVNLGGAFTASIRLLDPPVNQADTLEFSQSNYADAAALNAVPSTGSAVSFPVTSGWSVGGSNTSPDVSALVQSFIRRAAYNPQGSYIGFRIDPGDAAAGTYKAFDSLDKSGGKPAQLVVSYLRPGQFPTVVSVSPADGAVGIARDASITAIFSDPMNGSVVQQVTVTQVSDAAAGTLNSAVAGSASYDASARSLRFVPTAKLAAHATYEVRIATGTDPSGQAPLPGPKTWRFTTAADPGQAVTVVAADGSRVVIGAGSVGVAFGVRVTTAVVSTTTAGLAGTFVNAREFSLVDSSGRIISAALGSPAELTLPYLDADQDGIVDNTSVRESVLGVYWLDAARGAWVRLPDTTVNPVGNTVRASTPHFSLFALAASGASGLNGIVASPVPFRTSQGHTQIVFTGLPVKATIRVFTVAGEPVVQIEETDGDGRAAWDVKTSAGEPAAAGLYLYMVDDLTATRPDRFTGHLVVIR